MKGSSALLGGLAGACALTLVHETLRKVEPDAPRMDLLGENALSKLLQKMGTIPPAGDKLFGITMAGDVVSNAVYYSLAGTGPKRNVWLRGTLLGLGAGLGAVLLPKPLHLNPDYSNRTTKTKALTIALYLFGGLVAAAVIKKLDNEHTGLSE